MIFLTITWELILGVAGGIAVLFNAIKIIGNCVSPITDIKKKVEKHDVLLDNDHKRLTSIEQTNKMICKSLVALLDHEITGNGIDKLKTTKAEMQNYLIEKS